MADNQDISQNPGGVNTNLFTKGMIKDYNESFIGEGMYTHARNAANLSHDGQVGVIGNEPSNIHCVTLPYTLIGCVHLTDDQWIVFTTDDTKSEIGIFDESECSYRALRSPDDNPIDFTCLGFKRTNLITGVSRERFDCDRIVYFDDGLNPSRTINVTNVPVIKSCTLVGTCQICTEVLSGGLATLDCEAIRLASFVTHPCIKIKKGQMAGTLPNGSYQAAIAYLLNGSRVTDYIGLSSVQSLFTHENTSSALEITIENIDKDFDEFELVILSNINAQQVAKKIGTYSSTQGTIYVDRWSTEYVTVSISDIVLRTEPIEKSDAMYNVGDYLLRVGSYSKLKFNYQPLANKITANWLVVEYPADYYVKGNNRTGYMRDEVYAFFIRFIYNTGEYSESYHIPGRPALPSDTISITGFDSFEGTRPKWQVYNTGSIISTASFTFPYLEGGTIIARGNMAYWESTEKYPANKPDIWNTNPNIPGDPLNLCGKPIRHHKMPDETVGPQLSIFSPTLSISQTPKIRLLGVQFDNISFPLDNNGNPITSIVGYEILRGSREGNKSIIAKGLLNNMLTYNIPGNPLIKGLYQNYPYNDRNPDVYLTDSEQNSNNGQTVPDLPLQSYITGISDKIYSFHSPDTTFNNPYLNPNELKLYSEYNGYSIGRFIVPHNHPRFKIPSNATKTIITVANLAFSIAQGVYLASQGPVPLVTLPSSEDYPLSIQESVDYITNFPTTLALVPFPAIVGLNTAARTYNLAVFSFYAFFNFHSRNEKLYKVLISLIPRKQYAAQFVSHGFYNNIRGLKSQHQRRKILKSNYVSPQIQQFGSNYQINNLNRSNFVAIEVEASLLPPTLNDFSRYLISNSVIKKLYRDEPRQISSYYAGIKIPIPSQYGQLESIKQFPLTTYDDLGSCSPYITPNKPISKTGVLFDGDIYINRFTEKNTMFFFTDWLMGQPDLYEYDYTLYQNVPYSRFWVNNVEIQKFISVPDDYRVLDYISRGGLGTYIDRGYFYLFNSGVRDFFVESEVNVAYRDWEDQIPKRHYDVESFADLNLMFRSDYINNPNYYKYDYSLSISKLVNSHITWGNILERNYDPEVAETCYTYYPSRVRYSLPQEDESRRDTWRVFLANNYRDFSSEISSIKTINKTGALFMLKRQSPIQFTGVEELKLDANSNTKVTIGDGGLFSQPLQNVVNTDESYEYGSNQGRYCAINTTYGLFWISQNQGKVFQYQGGLNDVTNGGLKWWFAKFLPSQLLAMYPEYPYGDNPIVGVGAQLIYDNTNEIVYLTKKDYSPKFDSPSTLELRNGEFYLPNTNTPIPLTNTQYFEEANFTISYDPKSKAWVSFHDWIPTFLIPGKIHFLSVKDNSIWKHNVTCTSYCNFYGVNYPFEIEFVSSTAQQVSSMRSVEYILEVYNYSNKCRDKFHVLDQNFDQAIIYNSEQISGLLQLNLKAKNNPLAMLNYPQINPNFISIQYSKEENKYRFNQFWDITKNRGEYIPNAIPMFNLKPDGYKFDINPAYVNYAKSPLERKKFRHQINKVFLRKTVSGNNKFLFKFSNEKLLQSPR